jgi:Tol biopolymer transport system component
MITGSSSAGFGFAISDDGKQIAYRQTIWGPKQGERKQEIVLYNKETKERKVIAAGSDLSIPAFNTSTSKVAYLSTNKVYNVQKSSTSKPNVVLLGIDDKKIQLNIDGTKRNIDPFPDGSYIWPVLSPDKTMIVAYEMTYGAFIADLNGTVQKLLGRKDGPVWTRCGKWIVYMDENDDGHKILSSEICAVSLDSGIEVKLTQPSSIIKLHPHCSPTEDKIVFNTSEGELHILKYQEEQK